MTQNVEIEDLDRPDIFKYLYVFLKIKTKKIQIRDFSLFIIDVSPLPHKPTENSNFPLCTSQRQSTICTASRSPTPTSPVDAS
jgi:hypothetical protein